ncbi:FAD-dependent oxidoreductase [Rhodococcus sp. IEGM 1354]|uniref:NAD(P)/FAD-dependent oxidoreductase n=1 Tax=Rhodococcus sp. IEGM 1354 TaxID=3047088 RepID=UPI0024B732F1|nr:FAD-dependent oxidoreductase [Rhodococcus sp. IEGM 1354]MDI9933631.1 FAD-dependent oxidoreductase [Rhodococcus sp. IEGM 1354]
MTRHHRTVIVGASRAGLAAAQSLRQSNQDEHVTLIGEERWLPYDRTTLSKDVLAGLLSAEGAMLCAEEQLDGIDLRLGSRATALNVAESTVDLDNGSAVQFDSLVIATGATPRRLPGSAGLKGVHVLRTLDDSIGLAEDLAESDHIAIVGGGFIGAEIASTATALGRRVTLVEAGPAPMSAVLGTQIGQWSAQLHRSHGVDVRTDVRVDGITSRLGRANGLSLSDGSSVAADLVVMGVGVTPNVGWLAGSGLHLDNGVMCNDRLRAGPSIYAAGDVACWPNPLFDRTMRIEHWTNASEQGAAVGRAIATGEYRTFAPVPYVWSDQYNLRFQLYGDVAGADSVRIVSGSLQETPLVALYGRQDRLVAALGVNAAKDLLKYRRLITQQTSWDDVAAEMV